jgi:hypothetical protein
MKPLRPITIKFREGKVLKHSRVVSIKADRCGGVIPAGSSTFYCEFYWQGAKIATVPRSRLVPDDKAYKKLYGRPWIEELRNADKIVLSDYRDWETEIGGYPDDTNTIWRVNYDQHTWVIFAGTGKTSRVILHVMNNDEVTRKGNYKAVKKLFPGKKVFMLQTTVTSVEIT